MEKKKDQQTRIVHKGQLIWHEISGQKCPVFESHQNLIYAQRERIVDCRMDKIENNTENQMLRMSWYLTILRKPISRSSLHTLNLKAILEGVGRKERNYIAYSQRLYFVTSRRNTGSRWLIFTTKMEGACTAKSQKDHKRHMSTGLRRESSQW